jgi:RNA polymerase sigma factor (sigma-70 family)
MELVLPDMGLLADMPKSAAREELYNDPEILRLLGERDSSAQETIWRQEKGRLTAIATSILRSSSEAEVLVADVFCDFLFHYADRIQDGKSIPAYLRIMTVRRARRRKDRAARHVEVEPDTIGRDTGITFDESAESSIWSQWLEICLDGLTGRARKILKLHYGHDLSYSAIAGQLGKSKQAVGKTVLKSLEALRRCLEKHRAAAGQG